jgi:hypothetical protein
MPVPELDLNLAHHTCHRLAKEVNEQALWDKLGQKYHVAASRTVVYVTGPHDRFFVVNRHGKGDYNLANMSHALRKKHLGSKDEFITLGKAFIKYVRWAARNWDKEGSRILKKDATEVDWGSIPPDYDDLLV